MLKISRANCRFLHEFTELEMYSSRKEIILVTLRFDDQETRREGTVRHAGRQPIPASSISLEEDDRRCLFLSTRVRH